MPPRNRQQIRANVRDQMRGAERRPDARIPPPRLPREDQPAYGVAVARPSPNDPESIAAKNLIPLFGQRPRIRRFEMDDDRFNNQEFQQAKARDRNLRKDWIGLNYRNPEDLGTGELLFQRLNRKIFELLGTDILTYPTPKEWVKVSLGLDWNDLSGDERLFARDNFEMANTGNWFNLPSGAAGRVTPTGDNVGNIVAGVGIGEEVDYSNLDLAKDT